MQVAVIGINHKQADVTFREAIAQAILRHFSIGRTIASQVLLLTCNRAEIYFSGDNLPELHQRCLQALREEISFEFEQKCYSFFGKDCFLHLAQVTSGLDSALILESEIQGQVKQAYETAKSSNNLSSDLHFLFQKCLRIGKTIRTRFCSTKKSVPDLEQAIYLHAKQYFHNLVPAPLFVGASEINRKIALYLKKQGVEGMQFCNRTHEKAVLLAKECNGAVLPWHQLEASWPRFPWIITGVKSSQPLLLPGSNRGSKSLFMDLAVPRNIHPEVEGHLLNIDDLNRFVEERKRILHQTIQESQKLILASVEGYCTRPAMAC
jgi:glutamyl-tRNA reductase